jgi:C-methyltransferase C-terminal domain
VRDPISFLETIREANGGHGRIYIEVPCFDWICKHRAWFDIFYEHVNYFRLADFSRLFGSILEAGRIFGGQYLYVVAELGSLRRAADEPLEELHFPANFLAAVDDQARRLKVRQPAGTVIWGGASKGVTFAWFMERAGATIDLVIDTNPAKQGRYLAGTGHRVHSAEEALGLLSPHSQIIVMNGNYVDEIRHLTCDKFRYTVLGSDVI